MLKHTTLIIACWLLVSCSSQPNTVNSSPQTSTHSSNEYSKHAAWLTDMEQAIAIAKKENKHLFMFYTGSDWCPPCIKFHEEILDTQEFQQEATKHFVLVMLDYPSDTSIQTEEQIAHNQQWLEHYSVDAYPTVLLTEPLTKNPYATHVGHPGGDTNSYLNFLSKVQADKVLLDAALSKAENAQGIERARHLDEALSFESNFIGNRKALVDEILTLSKDAPDLYQKYDTIKDNMEVLESLKEIDDRLSDLYVKWNESSWDDEGYKQFNLSSLNQLAELEKKYTLSEGKALMELMLAKARFCASLKRNDEGFKPIEAAIINNQYSSEFRQKLAYELSSLYSDYQRLDDAIKMYDQAITIAPNSELGKQLQSEREEKIEEMKEDNMQ